MRLRHSIGSKQLVRKGKITASISKGKSSKKSIPGIGRPSPSTMKVTTVLPMKPIISKGDDKEQPLTDLPAVPVLRSPPPFGPRLCQMPSPTQLLNTMITDKSNSDSVSGTDVITSTAADTTCNALVNVPRMRAGTPKPPSKPGSVLDNSLSWSVPLTHPLSRAATTLATAVTNTLVILGPSAPLRQMSQPKVHEECYSQPWFITYTI